MKTFGELTREEKIELVTAWIDGAEVEYLEDYEFWRLEKNPSFYSDIKYRIKPTKPSINWDHVHPDYKWLAVDEDGMAYLFERKPEFDCDTWVNGGERTYAKAFASYKPSTCDWEDSLVRRPE